MKKFLVFFLLILLTSCASIQKSECVRPSATFHKLALDDLGDASRLEQVARKNYSIHKEWVNYAECLAK